MYKLYKPQPFLTRPKKSTKTKSLSNFSLLQINFPTQEKKEFLQY